MEGESEIALVGRERCGKDEKTSLWGGSGLRPAKYYYEVLYLYEVPQLLSKSEKHFVVIIC